MARIETEEDNLSAIEKESHHESERHHHVYKQMLAV
jgi:hypothetical protein